MHTHSYTHIHSCIYGTQRPHQWCSVLQCVAVCCSVLNIYIYMVCSVPTSVAACCSVLQCDAVCCSVLHRVDIHVSLVCSIFTTTNPRYATPICAHMIGTTPQHAVSRCNKLLHAAKHCHTLRRSGRSEEEMAEKGMLQHAAT